MYDEIASGSTFLATHTNCLPSGWEFEDMTSKDVRHCILRKLPLKTRESNSY